MIFLYSFIFIFSLLLLYWSGSRLVDSLIKVCHFLRWREFVVAFFIMALATSFSNFFLDINAAIQKIPELALGDIMGGNIADLTIIMGMVIVFGNIVLPAESKMVQTTALFTAAIALLPMLLISDGWLDRTDGIIMILSFFIYSLWLFTKKERFKKDYNDKECNEPVGARIRNFFKSLKGIFLFSIVLFASSEGIILSAKYFSSYFNVSMPIIGILLVGLGNCAPELYFSLISARKKQSWLILGNLMGSVIVCATLVLGIVALISPFKIADFSPFIIARIFLIISALFFLFAVKTGRRITKLEGLFLILLYFIFVAAEIYFK